MGDGCSGQLQGDTNILGGWLKHVAFGFACQLPEVSDCACKQGYRRGVPSVSCHSDIFGRSHIYALTLHGMGVYSWWERPVAHSGPRGLHCQARAHHSGGIFPIALARLVPVSHFGNSHIIYNSFMIIFVMVSVISDYDSVKAQRMVSTF